MCDDITETENESWLERSVGRRDLARIGLGAAAIVALPACSSDSAGAKSPDGGGEAPSASAASSATVAPSASSRAVVVDTPDGKADGFFVFQREGKHPGVVLWPDIAGPREAYQAMATRLAEQGYAVLVVNQYYRSAKAPVLASFAEWKTEAGKEKLKPMIEAITPEGTTRDGAAFVAWLDQQPEVDANRKVGTAGYCMGGPFAIRTAAAAPARVGAVASFHGANLASDKPESPHLLIGKTQARYLIAIAQNDDERQPEAKTKLRESAESAKLSAEVEVYAAQHGFCTIDSPVYDKAEAERAWARMLATFQAAL
ncbi:MAG: dienelactone hydrolase family protein [Myxococcales bacterium]|nr:dienelactone hydrolase family protein [Myxococcales bacterium]